MTEPANLYLPRRLLSLAIAPVYLLLLAFWIEWAPSTAGAWLKACNGFVDFLGYFTPLPARIDEFRQAGASPAHLLVLQHYAIIGQLGGIICTAFLMLSASMRGAARSEKSKGIPIVALLSFVPLIVAMIVVLIVLPADMIFYVQGGAIALNAFMLVMYYGFFPPSIGFQIWLIVSGILSAKQRGGRLA